MHGSIKSLCCLHTVWTWVWHTGCQPYFNKNREKKRKKYFTTRATVAENAILLSHLVWMFPGGPSFLFVVAEQHKWHLRKVYALEEQQAVSAKPSLVHCYREMWTWLLRTCIAGLQAMNGSRAWTDDMRVSVCAHPHPCQTSGCSFSMIYKRVCSHHTDLAHDLGA